MKITAQCSCGAPIHLDVFLTATSVHKRTCRRCRYVWRIKVTPLPSRKKGLHLHQVELIPW